MKTTIYCNMRRAVAVLAAGLALGGIVGTASGQIFQMYRMQTLGSGGGVPAAPVLNGPILNGTNVTLSWYGTMGWYTIQGSTNLLGGPWNNVKTVEANSYAWQCTFPDINNSDSFQLSQANLYAGSDACSGCHAAEYTPWTATVHANAYNDLVNSHEQDASCVLCHTVGFGQPTGFNTNSPVASLEGVGCEDCHGPAGWHKNSDHAVILPAISVDPEICGSCHSGHNPQYNEYTNSPHYLVDDTVNYGVTGGYYVSNTIVVGATTLYGYYVVTNASGPVSTNATSGIISSACVPGSSVDPGNDTQSSCGVCHSAATRMAMLNDYANRLAGYTNALTMPIASDAGAWGPSCAICHDPHSLNPSPVFAEISNAMVLVATNYVQLRSPLWSSNFYTMPSQSDKRYDSSGNPYYMNTTFSSMYNPSINICGQCHNTSGARWDGRAYGLITNVISVTNLVISAAYTNTYTTNYNGYGQIVGILTNTYPTGGTTTNTIVANDLAVTTGLTTSITGFSQAPHLSPQYNMLIGILQPDYLNTTNGSTFYTNGVLNNGLGIYATHAGIAAHNPYNTNQCATCHVPSYTGPSSAVTGHTFHIDPNGCALGGCHNSTSHGIGAPDYIDYAIENSNLVVSVADLLNRWATNNAPAIFPGTYNNYLQNSWEYTSPGALGSTITTQGPSASDQLLLPTAIQQARYDIYMVYSDGTFETHNPTFIPLLIKDAETKVMSQFKTAMFNSSKTYGGPGAKITFSNLNSAATSCVWNFGDGGSTNTATSVSVTHVYTNVGPYTVSLTATDSNGTQTMTRNGYIHIYPVPTPSYSYGTQSKHTLTLTNTSVNANFGNWAFYNGSVSTANEIWGVASPVNMAQFYTFTNAGSYTVVFTASSPGGTALTTNTISVP